MIELAQALDAAADGRVLVFGSPPPGGRDLDILVRPEHEQGLTDCLRARGLVARGSSWVAFRDCTAFGVDLVPAGEWDLPPAQLEALFVEADELPGFRNLVTPAPHHALLIAARRVERAGRYDERLRARVAAILERAPAGMPSVWEQAAPDAAAWGAVRQLAALRALHAGGGAQPGVAARARSVLARTRSLRCERRSVAARGLARRLTRRPVIVALSGLDGAGKSFQAKRLQESLDRLGWRAAVIWPPGGNVMFQASPAVKRRLFAVLRALGKSPVGSAPASSQPAPASSQPAPASSQPAPASSQPASATVRLAEPPLEPLPRQWAPVTHALALVVAFAQASALRRGARGAASRADVLIYDRYALDSIVYMRHRWGQGRGLVLQSALIRLLARRPHRAFLLDVPPEVAFARKQDFPLENLSERAALYRELHTQLGCERLDGERPPEELCAQIARSVWELLA